MELTDLRTIETVEYSLEDVKWSIDPPFVYAHLATGYVIAFSKDEVESLSTLVKLLKGESE